MATKKEKELARQIAAMRMLGMTDDEIKDVVECDKRIDHGEKLFSLDPEKEKASKEIRSTTSVDKKSNQPTAYKFDKRERKANNDKRELMEIFRKVAEEIGTDVEVTNIEREMIFYFHGTKYRITLAQPRT